MKLKHFYLLCMGVLLVVMAVSMSLMVRAFSESPYTIQRPLVRLTPISQGPLPELLTEMNVLEPELDSLAKPTPGKRLLVRLEALGYQRMKKPGVRKGPQLRLEREFGHSVSFAFIGDGKRFCVVDGSFYPEGAPLPNGGKILKVMPQRVLIEEGKIKRWFPVKSSEDRSKKKQIVPGETK